jgi:hypothetical protein
MFDCVDINEKWFYKTRDGKNYILTAAEFEEEAGVEDDDKATPHRTIRHKCHIPKVMFLCAQAWPRWEGGICIAMLCGMVSLDFGPLAIGLQCKKQASTDRLGQWCGTTKQWQKRCINDYYWRKFSQQSRKSGQGAIGNDQTLSFEFNKMAPPHILIQTMSYYYKDYKNWTLKTRFYFTLNRRTRRIATSMTFVFFWALQALYQKSTPGNVGEIIAHVQQAYKAYDYRKINQIWLSLQCCLNEIIKHHGNNDYKLVHMQKDRLEREGQLPVTVAVCDMGVELFT